ncbi:MAG: hypothetical protein M1839_005300 [Geoglossum umbratile]|nr:MAG: hypothetical protein M1839_005300 [Geoglossum umbratile]
MTAEIMLAIVSTVHAALGNQYGVIGGVAMNAYGRTRGTADLDIIVPARISEVVEGTLLGQQQIVRTTGGKIGYVDPRSRLCYGIDITSDREITQPFDPTRDVQRGMGGNIVTPQFLLNSKAYSCLTRIGPKKTADLNDFAHMANYIYNNRITPNLNARWVIDHDFWQALRDNGHGPTEQYLTALGYEKERTPNQSNRESVVSYRRSSGSNGGNGRNGRNGRNGGNGHDVDAIRPATPQRQRRGNGGNGRNGHDAIRPASRRR